RSWARRSRSPAPRRSRARRTSGSSARAPCSIASWRASGRWTRMRAAPRATKNTPAAWTYSEKRATTMKTILAVDDSATMREMVAFVLESAGYRVIEAEDGAQGLDRATTTSCDLVITDQNMPNMDGLTLVRSLRELREYKSVPILLLTTE